MLQYAFDIPFLKIRRSRRRLIIITRDHVYYVTIFLSASITSLEATYSRGRVLICSHSSLCKCRDNFLKRFVWKTRANWKIFVEKQKENRKDFHPKFMNHLITRKKSSRTNRVTSLKKISP